MNGIEAKEEVKPDVPAPGLSKRILLRVLAMLGAFFVVGLILRQIGLSVDASSSPAGFGRGMLQGALMPLALPNLLIGSDVVIYTQNNTGINYKLGYTVGVNICGLIFFGLLFLRLVRWRKWRNRNNGDMR